jgi:deoxyribodipyrimidine photo-lyase
MTANVCVFVFRRDFRVVDNTAFFHAVEYCKQHNACLWPVFVFNDQQISPEKNAYYSERCFRFMMHALYNLNEHELNGQLDFLKNNRGDSDDLSFLMDVLSQRDPNLRLTAVFFNKDLTPYAKRRDRRMIRTAHKRSIHVGTFEDYTIYPVNTILNKSGTPYLVFTSFYNTLLKRKIPVSSFPKPSRLQSLLLRKKKPLFIEDPRLRALLISNPQVTRAHALRVLRDKKTFAKYKDERNCMGLERATTLLGPYLKFGLISTREAVRSFVASYGATHELVKQLYWREFYYITHDAFPKMLGGQVGATNQDFNPNILSNKSWDRRTSSKFRKWATGNTGAELVDAAMRQLNTTGYMHNRGRMVTASYLIKNLNIDWRDGERYFATQLVDYDPCQNNSGWQWSSGGGVSANPWYRKFNPDIQASKYDPTGAYRRRYLLK